MYQKKLVLKRRREIWIYASDAAFWDAVWIAYKQECFWQEAAQHPFGVFEATGHLMRRLKK